MTLALNTVSKAAESKIYGVVNTDERTVTTYSRNLIFTDSVLSTKSYEDYLHECNDTIILER